MDYLSNFPVSSHWISPAAMAEGERLIYTAYVVCMAAHTAIGQRRKYTDEPYHVHCLEVADIVRKVTDDPEVIAAALCHDVLEDTDMDYDTLVFLLTKRTADLVAEVSKVSTPEDGDRAARLEIDCEHCAKASEDGKTIKLANIISNGKSIVERDPDFAKTYIPEKKKMVNALKGGSSRLCLEALMMLTTAFRELGIDRD